MTMMRNIMVKAHEMAKQMEGNNYRAKLTLALIEVWAEVKENKEYSFDFEASNNDTRKGIPYVARLVWNAETGKIDREFFEMSRQYGKRDVTVSGSFSAKENEIIEQRRGGSWNNDYRYWYLVQNGKLVKVADIDNSRQKATVEQYLKGKISAEALVA